MSWIIKAESPADKIKQIIEQDFGGDADAAAEAIKMLASDVMFRTAKAGQAAAALLALLISVLPNVSPADIKADPASYIEQASATSAVDSEVAVERGLEIGDEVQIVDPDSEYSGKVGTIESTGQNYSKGKITDSRYDVKLSDGTILHKVPGEKLKLYAEVAHFSLDDKVEITDVNSEYYGQRGTIEGTGQNFDKGKTTMERYDVLLEDGTTLHKVPVGSLKMAPQ
jgi:hypothetical protein